MPNANVKLAGTKADAASANGTAMAACTNTNTAPTWTNKPGALRPVESQQVVTNSATQYINVPDEISPARRTYNPSTSAAGDTEAIAAKGRLVLVNGAAPALLASLSMNPSELFSQRNMTYNENSIALPSDRGSLEVSGANLMYEGARVKSWMLGRDVNPAGRGDGSYYAQGAFSIGSVRPSPTTTPVGGWGNSVNNGDITSDDFTNCMTHITNCTCAPLHCMGDLCTYEEWHRYLSGVSTDKDCCEKYRRGSSICAGDPCCNCCERSMNELNEDGRSLGDCWHLLCGPADDDGEGKNGKGNGDGGCGGGGGGIGGSGDGFPPDMPMPGPDEGEVGPMGFYYGSIAPSLHFYSMGLWPGRSGILTPSGKDLLFHRGFVIKGCSQGERELIKDLINGVCSALDNPDCMRDAPNTKNCIKANCSASRGNLVLKCRKGSGGKVSSKDRSIAIGYESSAHHLLHELYHYCDWTAHLGGFTNKSREQRAWACMFECFPDQARYAKEQMSGPPWAWPWFFGSNDENAWQGKCCDPPADSGKNTDSKIPGAVMPGRPGDIPI